MTQGIVANRKKKAAKGLDHYLLYPDVDVADLARPSMRYRAGLRALGEIAEMNVSPTRSFENMLDQFDRKCDVMLDQKAQDGIDAGQFTGSKRQLDLLEADFIKNEKRRRIELEVQAEVEGQSSVPIRWRPSLPPMLLTILSGRLSFARRHVLTPKMVPL